jgi:hypothetical protein
MGNSDDRRPGRPPLQRGERSVSVCVKLPSAQFDAACRRAAADRMSVPELLRRAASSALRATDDEDDDD